MAHFYCCRTRPPAHLWLIFTMLICPRRMAGCSLPVHSLLLEQFLVPYSPLTGWTLVSKHLYVCPSGPDNDSLGQNDAAAHTFQTTSPPLVYRLLALISPVGSYSVLNPQAAFNFSTGLNAPTVSFSPNRLLYVLIKKLENP